MFTAVAHQVAVVLLDDIADMDADAKFDPPFRRHACVSLDHGALDFDRAADRVDHAAKLDDAPVPGALDGAASVCGDGRVDHVASDAAKTGERPLLVGAREPAIAHDIRNENCCEFPVLAHVRAQAFLESVGPPQKHQNIGVFRRIPNESREQVAFGRIRP